MATKKRPVVKKRAPAKRAPEPMKRRPILDPSMSDLVRVQLSGITVSLSWLKDMSPNAERAICELAVDALKNDAVMGAIRYLISQQVDFTVKRAETMDQVLFGRATINGLALFQEELEAMAARAEELRKGDEPFDPNAAV